MWDDLKKVWAAWCLWRLGKRLERARGRLRWLYEKGVGVDEPKMCRAIRRFNRLCYRWLKMEEEYKSGRP